MKTMKELNKMWRKVKPMPHTALLMTNSKTPVSRIALESVNLAILHEDPLTLDCLNCEQAWEPSLLPDGSWPRRFWRCPNGCNSHFARMSS
jgi:hypothetical protein